VVDRKNWLFCDTVGGTNASVNLYRLIETAKASGIEPYAYLRTVLTELPQATSVDEFEVLLPLPDDGTDSAWLSLTASARSGKLPLVQRIRRYFTRRGCS